MNINFQYNGQNYNHPVDKKNINIQTKIREKIEELLNPIRDDIELISNGHIDINYEDEHIDRPSIKVNGFDGGNTINILMLLKPMIEYERFIIL